MPSIYQIKPAFQGLLRPLVRRLAQAGVTANQVTLAAAVLSILAGLAIADWPLSAGIWFLLPVVLFLRMALNAIDGMLAREHGQKSALGAFLNELCDVISDAALYLPFALLPGAMPLIVIVAVLLAALSEMAGVVALLVCSLLSSIALLYGAALAAQLEALRTSAPAPQDEQKVIESDPASDAHRGEAVTS